MANLLKQGFCLRNLGLAGLLVCGTACGLVPNNNTTGTPTNGGATQGASTSGQGSTSTSPQNANTPPTQDGNTTAPQNANTTPVGNANCATVDPQAEIMISKVSVVDDPQRAQWHGNLADPTDGAWSFGRIMTNLAGSQAPADFVLNWLKNWEVDQQINGQVVPARKGGVDDQIITPWTKDANGKLDLTQSPLRLLSISNRLDLRQPKSGSAGELRLLYEFTAGPSGAPQQFTVIFEFNMPITADRDALAWAKLWHGLNNPALDAASYNAALQAITDLVTVANSDPQQAGGSALFRVRTNEIQLDTINNPPEWEMRQYEINSRGALAEVSVGVTPALALNQSTTLATFINDNATTIVGGTLTVPTTFNGVSFAAASVLTIPFSLGPNPADLSGAVMTDSSNGSTQPAADIAFWNASGITNNDARAIVSLNTCNGCHGVETNTHFVHMGLRNVGEASVLSGFLTGETVKDPAVPATQRTYGDLARRAQDLQGVLCSGTGTQVGTGVEARPTGL